MESGDTVLLEIVVRMIAAGAVVVIVSCAAQRSGPAIGGVIAGLPVVLGPGFFFLLRVRAQFWVGGLTQMLHSALLGTTSLAMFCFVLSTGALWLPPAAAFLIASFMSVATAVLLLMGGMSARERPR